MKTIYSAADHSLVTYLQTFLDSQGIPAEARVPYAAAASGEIPFSFTWPQLVILRDEDVPRAQTLVDEALAAKGQTRNWVCAGCGEELEGEFDTCWHCGRHR